MPNSDTLPIGAEAQLHFVWQLPDTDYLRTIFKVRVVDIDRETQRYIVQLEDLVAGRQEDLRGEQRPREAYSQVYWQLVGKLLGRRAAVAFEAVDQRPLFLQLSTLTLEHKFFRRFEEGTA